MGTRCIIAEYTNGAVVGSYCHYDGYIEYTGKTLMEYYNTPELAHEIANIGYASILEEDIELTRIQAVHKNENTLFFESVEDFIERASDYGAEFLYLWNEGAWNVAQLYVDDERFEALENFTA